ncbi:MAG: hypothetical protein WB791_09890 [Waddliaceae bacterium]
MNLNDVFTIRKGNVFAVPVIHYKMEIAAQVHLAFAAVKPDCVAVELAETMQLQLVHAASRLPDISIVITSDQRGGSLYYLCEPCDAAFEALRSALENQLPAYCIDLDVDEYPNVRERLPDPYSIQRIGFQEYYSLYRKIVLASGIAKSTTDQERELYMARRLKELSLSYDRILFVGGMAHVENVLKLMDKNSFSTVAHAERKQIEICTLTEQSCREVMAESGWISKCYDEARTEFDREKGSSSFLPQSIFPPDRQKLIYSLYKESAKKYTDSTESDFPGYHFRNIMKYARNYALVNRQLMPDLFQILTAAKGCVDHNYAYETWELATDYPPLRNVDNLPELNLSIEEVWGHSKMIRFHLKEPSRKGLSFHKRRKDRSQFRFEPPGPFSICSYPPEDVMIEEFGNFLKKKGTKIFSEEGAKTVPFSTSLEDGINTRETIRHWPEKKLYVNIHGKPPAGVGSIVVIFDPDSSEEDEPVQESYPWRTTWLGEHEQESDMAFYSTSMGAKVVGPGISRCEYGGFMMSYPPRRMFDVWQDPDYRECRNKAEVLLMAAIDYAVKPVVVYVAQQPPKAAFKRFAQRYGKKIVYIPIGQLSPITLSRLRKFHVLDGRGKREIADEYID